MLPESLSNGVCSLKPQEDRLVMSALMEFDPAGNMRSARMTPGIIRSFERMTYTNVNKVIEKDPEMTARYAPFVRHFANMKELALLLNARRNEHGSIDFDLPEQVIEFDDQQRMVSIGRSVRNTASTKNPRRAKSSSSKSWPAPSATPSASKICSNAKLPFAMDALQLPRAPGAPTLTAMAANAP
jgi:exoribonuclease R